MTKHNKKWTEPKKISSIGGFRI